MDEIGKFENKNEIEMLMKECNIIEVSNEMLMDANELTHSNSKSYVIPLAEISTLGAGVSSLLPTFRTITENVTMDTTGLYRLANESVGDVLKVAKNGNFWGSFKTEAGKSKFVQLQKAEPITTTSTTVMPIDPATAMMAVALYSVEKKLNEIEQNQKQIISFLEIEKQSEIKADVEMLSKFVKNYKNGWNKPEYLVSDYKMLLDIKRTTIKHMNSFKENIEKMIEKKHLFIPKNKVEAVLMDFEKKFTYYRLALYTYSLASFLEIMYKGDFSECYINDIKSDVMNYSMEYRSIYTNSSIYLEKMVDSLVEKNIVKSLGVAEEGIGKVIGSIPIVNKGKVDEFLIDSGSGLKKCASIMEEKFIKNFSELNNPKTGIFVEKMDDMIRIYNYTKSICFDKNNLYVLTDCYN